MPAELGAPVHPATARERMVERDIAGGGVRNERVLDAMRAVPREAFVAEELEELAYDDAPLPIGEGQTISQPLMVALMAEAAEIGPRDRVLEIGAGSGYAAAVFGRLAARVFTVERHASLAETARERLARLGYGNIDVRCGDGTRGLPDAAPFDAILVAAGGPAVPDSLRRQLAVGGRLVIPVGGDRRLQRLLCVRRIGAEEYEEEDLGPVAFVPLIGAEGWDGEKREKAGAGRSWLVRRQKPLPALIRDAAEPLPEPEDSSFADWVDRYADARIVLLGEASHGTSEFYRARAAITRHLVERHGFGIVAVEADWPDAASIDAYVRDRPASVRERPFRRFPVWMWRNEEFRDFVEWLRRYDLGLADPERRVSFHGLDLYNLNGSIRAVLDYLDEVDPAAARVARERYGCLTPWQKDPATYGRAALTRGYAPCEEHVVAMLSDLLKNRLDYAGRDGESFLDAQQNARLVAAAERYYRVMYYGSRESWNLRDRHMLETLEAVLAARGSDRGAKAVVWAHNSHIGDARATEMGRHGELNIGQLCRERFGDEAVLIGFGTDRGTVAAADDWDGPMEVMNVRPSHRDSYERQCREAGLPRFLLDLRGRRDEAVVDALRRNRLERAIGVIYRPETELASHYFEAELPAQFDAYLWFDETRAVTPLGGTAPRAEPAETYPFGV